MNWLLDPSDARVVRALGWSCDVCKAKPGVLCGNPVVPGVPLAGRVVHYGRLVDRRLK